MGLWGGGIRPSLVMLHVDYAMSGTEVGGGCTRWEKVGSSSMDTEVPSHGLPMPMSAI